MQTTSKISLNNIAQIIAILPIFIALISIVQPFIGLQAFYGSPEPDMEIHHILGIWIWLFAVSYLILLVAREKPIFAKVEMPTRLAFSVGVAIAMVESFSDTYGVGFLIWLAGLTAFFMWGLHHQLENPKTVESGKYPLTLDKRGKIGIPTDSIHENIQIVGGTGTGKTRYAIKPFIEQTIRQGLGCFVYDVKGNLDRDVSFYMQRHERQDRAFHFNLVEPWKSNTFNPLYGDDPDAIANRLHTALYYDTRNSETFYLDLAQGFLLNLIGLLKKEIKTLTFKDILIPTEEVETFKTIQWLCDRYPDTGQAMHFRNFWLGKSPKQRQQDLAGLIIKLQRFCNSGWAHLLNVRYPDVTMEEVVGRGRVFLFSPDAVRYPADAKPLAIMAMMALSEQSAGRSRDDQVRPFRAFLDEFYNLAYPRFIDLINKCRESRINLVFAHQSIGDLESVSPEFAEQVRNSVNNKIILRVNDPETAEAFAREFGTELDRDYQVQSFDAAGSLAGYAKPQVEKFKFHPNLFKSQRVGQAVVRISYKKRPHFQQIDLAPATPVPEGYRIENFEPSSLSRSKTGECSVVEMLEAHEKGYLKPPQKRTGLMGGEIRG